MNSERINELINKIPFGLILFGYFGYLGFEYYTFTTDESSALIQKTKEIETAKANNNKLQNKLKELSEFLRVLEQKKLEIRKMAQSLQETKNTLAEKIDVPAFMKMVITEAKKVGLNVVSLKPGGSEEKAYYIEEKFNLQFKGAYIQLLTFLDRISSVNEIIRIEEFSMEPVGTPYAKFVELQGDLVIKTYRYRGTNEDKIGGSEDTAGEGKK